MQIKIHAKGFDLTEAMKEHVERKLGYALDRFDEEGVLAQVTLEDVNGPRGGNDKHCRINLSGLGTKTELFNATERDLYVAIDAAAEKASRWAARATKRDKPAHPDPSGSATIRKPKGT